MVGIPQAMILRASGHSSEEWKRYLNVTPDRLRRLLEPIGEQTVSEVKEYARSVMKVAGAAIFILARKATEVDPIVALRCD
jgi:hypothetical protein